MNNLRRRLERLASLSTPEAGGLNHLEAETSWYHRYRYQIYGVLLLTLLITLLFPSANTAHFGDLREGRVYIGTEIIAPFTFPVNKSHEEYEADLYRARSSIAPVFLRDSTVAQVQENALNHLFEALYDLLRKPSLSRSELQDCFEQNGIALSGEDLGSLLTSAADGRSGNGESRPGGISSRLAVARTLHVALSALLKEGYSGGILNVEKSNLPVEFSRISIWFRGQEMLEDKNYYRGPQEAQNWLLNSLRANGDLTDDQARVAYKIGSHFLVANLHYNALETNGRQEQAMANVPLAKDQVLAGERIIDSHERISKQHIDKLNSFAMARAERKESVGWGTWILFRLSQFFFVLFVLGILLAFMYKTRTEIVSSPKQLLLIGLMFLTSALTIFVVNELKLPLLILPITTGIIIIAVFFDIYVGLFYAISVSLLTGAMRGYEYGITFISLFAGVLAILSVSRVRTRRWVLRTMGVIMVAYVLATFVHDNLNYLPFREILANWGYGLINGFLSPIFAYGLIMILEYAFNMTTDMTLLELSDLNHPLLRQLAMQAPGTYHHSIMVGNLAEAAAESIGGNSLLARVGAYYHDIGKMEKPEYFVENQQRGRNPQEKLTPTMSSLVLLNHVRRGSEMAREFRLPKVIEAFIYEHHGTSLMNYFYQKAVEQSKGEYVSDTEFRYPGPRPQSRETAIVMLADAVEAMSRTLKDPSPSRIKQIVEHMVDERFKSGELDDSPLTLQDLSRISEAFQKILIGLFHRRIDYPQSPVNAAGKEGA
jgi:putative nucleotidyltransferase with HDIG domain